MEKTFPALKEQLPEVTKFIEDELESLDCPMRETMQISIAVEEIFINIASYSYPNLDGSAKITFDAGNSGITISFCDNGVPFNPLERKDPDVDKKAEDDTIGGLGIYMVKQTMDNVEYRYENGYNILTIRKTW